MIDDGSLDSRLRGNDECSAVITLKWESLPYSGGRRVCQSVDCS